MNNPRILLKKKLLKARVDSQTATVIALDAGSSQVIVNKSYLKQFDILDDKILTVLKLVKQFYAEKSCMN